MAFGDSSVQNLLHELNAYLADHSYMRGYIPSKADLTVFDALGQQLPHSFPHIQRWYRQIESFDRTEKAGWNVVTVSQPTVNADDVAKAARDNIGVMDAKV